MTKNLRTKLLLETNYKDTGNSVRMTRKEHEADIIFGGFFFWGLLVVLKEN